MVKLSEGSRTKLYKVRIPVEQIETCIETCNIMRKLLICCSPYTARGRQTGSPDPESKSVEVIEAHPGSAVEKAIENTDTLRRGVSGVI